jgi:hypothetical protein
MINSYAKDSHEVPTKAVLDSIRYRFDAWLYSWCGFRKWLGQRVPFRVDGSWQFLGRNGRCRKRREPGTSVYDICQGVGGSSRLFTKLWGQRRFCSWLSALSDNAKSIIVKVSKAVSAALDEFHFSVEAFGDAIVFSKAPHGRNRFDTGFEGLGEGH